MVPETSRLTIVLCPPPSWSCNVFCPKLCIKAWPVTRPYVIIQFPDETNLSFFSPLRSRRSRRRRRRLRRRQKRRRRPREGQVHAADAGIQQKGWSRNFRDRLGKEQSRSRLYLLLIGFGCLLPVRFLKVRSRLAKSYWTLNFYLFRRIRTSDALFLLLRVTKGVANERSYAASMLSILKMEPKSSSHLLIYI